MIDTHRPTITDFLRSKRHMLTDTSGISHVPISPLLREYCAKGYSTYPLPIGGETDIPDPLAAPPVGDPGAEWVHGTNIDWAGKLVERATGMDLESYMQQNICTPLGITDITFKLHQRPEMLARRADLTKRSPEDGKLYYDDTIFFRKFPEECYAGSGMFASPAAFTAVMHSLLKRDGVLLKPETVDQMFVPALNETMERGMNEHFNKVIRFINCGYPLPQWPTLRRNFGFGAIVIMQDLDGDKWRRKGSMSINCGWNVGLVSAALPFVRIGLEGLHLRNSKSTLQRDCAPSWHSRLHHTALLSKRGLYTPLRRLCIRCCDTVGLAKGPVLVEGPD